MHFKSAVILCAVVHFFASVRSAGLNSFQIEECIKLDYYHKSQDSIIDMPNVMFNVFGIEDCSNIFVYNRDEPDDINVIKLFLALAYNGKFDSFGVPMLTSFEVDFFLDKFMGTARLLNENAYLFRNQLSVLLDQLYVDINKKSSIMLLSGEKTSAADFLYIMLTVLPEGNGLSKAQIKEFVVLYRYHRTETGSINTLDIYSIFQGFDMASEPLAEGLFNSNRPAAKELMELMIVTAERSKSVHNDDEIVLSTNEVRSLIQQFTELDTDKDGLLCNDEAKNFLKVFLSKHLEVPATFNFDDREVNVAEYLLCYMYKKSFSLQLYTQVFSGM